MKKFENVDLIETLRKIMSHNTRFYQSDFQYDIKALTHAAESETANKSFLWMSRDSGTWCLPERDVYIKNIHPHNTWLFYQNEKNIKAFWVDVFPMKDRQVRGDICEINYLEHIKDVDLNSVMPSAVEILFRNPNNFRTFDYEEYNKNWLSIGNRYGTMSEIKYLVPNENYLQNVIYNAKEACFNVAQPASADKYINHMIKEHFSSRGYTANDMAFVIPDDVYNALKYGIPAYGLYPSNIKQQIVSKEDAQHFISDNVLIGIKHQDKQLLDYLVEQPSIKNKLFDREELRQLFAIAIQAGKSDNIQIGNKEVLDGIINKLEKLVFPINTEGYEDEQSLASEMETEPDNEL